MIDYVESPIGRVSGVAWPAGWKLIVGTVTNNSHQNFYSFLVVDADSVPITDEFVAAGADLQKVLRGKSSGATADFRAIPVVASSAVGNAPTADPCDTTLIGYATFPGGTPLSSPQSGKWNGATIVEQRKVGPLFLQATAARNATADYSWTGSACALAGSPDAVEGFILNEEVELLDAPP